MKASLDQMKFVITLVVGAFTFGMYLAAFEARVGAVEKTAKRNEKSIEKTEQKLIDLHYSIFRKPQ